MSSIDVRRWGIGLVAGALSLSLAGPPAATAAAPDAGAAANAGGPAAGNTARVADVAQLAAGSEIRDTAVVTDSGGGATAAWIGKRGGAWVVQAASRPAGGGWGPAVDLAPAAGEVSSLSLAVRPDGTAVAAWIRGAGSPGTAESASRPAGGTWGATTPISGAGVPAAEVTVAAAATGAVTAVWTTKTGNPAADRAMASDLAADGTWGGAQEIGPAFTGAWRSFPQLGFDAAGNATVIYLSYAGPDWQVNTSSRPVSGGWAAPQALTAGANNRGLDLAVAANGTAMAGWTVKANASGGKAEVPVVATRTGGTWASPEDLTSPPYDADKDFYWVPSLAFDSDHNAYVLTGGLQLTVRRRAPGGSWKEQLLLEGKAASKTDLVESPGGQMRAVYVKRVSSKPTFQVMGTRLAGNGGTWRVPSPVSGVLGPVDALDLAPGTAGAGVAVWAGADGAVRVQSAPVPGDGDSDITRAKLTRFALKRHRIHRINSDEGPRKVKAVVRVTEPAAVRFEVRRKGKVRLSFVRPLDAGRNVVVLRSVIDGKRLKPGFYMVTAQVKGTVKRSPKKWQHLRIRP